jgi:hypothetical protein
MLTSSMVQLVEPISIMVATTVVANQRSEVRAYVLQPLSWHPP